jgi:hypothetical protein
MCVILHLRLLCFAVNPVLCFDVEIFQLYEIFLFSFFFPLLLRICFPFYVFLSSLLRHITTALDNYLLHFSSTFRFTVVPIFWYVYNSQDNVKMALGTP